MKTWEIKQTGFGTPECKALLDAGWEPFTVAIVTTNNQLNPQQIIQMPIVFLKKPSNDAAPLRAV